MFGGSQQLNVPEDVGYWSSVGGSGGNTTNFTQILAPMPAATADGDLMFLFAAGFCAAGAGCISSPGFTTQVQGAGGQSTSHVFWAATRIAASEPGTDYTVTFSAAAWACAVLLVLRSTTGVSMVANAASYTNNLGYSSVLVTPALTIAIPADATIYGYGGQASTLSGTLIPLMYMTGLTPGVGSNSNNAGSFAACGWAVNATPPDAQVTGGSGSADVMDVAIDVVPN